jgi:hypothetical protein
VPGAEHQRRTWTPARIAEAVGCLPRRGSGGARGSRRAALAGAELAEQFGGGLVGDAEAGAERVAGDRLAVLVRCPAVPDPAVLAALARQTLGLPSPVIRSSPVENALQLTNLPTWLWINPAEWVPESKTATVPGESVTATAPVSVTWHPGDGSTVTCQGGGHPVRERG